MPAPVIDPRTSIQTAKAGEAFTFQLAAFDAPTSWTALHLPAGLSINASTGLVSGTPTTPGLYQVAIRATNADGSDQVFLLIPVLDEEIDEERMGGWNDLVIDFDLTGRQVTLHGGGGGGNGLFPVASDDSGDLLVGFYRDGVLCDVNPDGEEMSVKLALKEFEPEILLTLAGGTPEKVVVGDSVRYRIKYHIDPDAWGPVLSSYDGDLRTLILATSEIELKVGLSMYAQNKSLAPFEVKGDMQGGYGHESKVYKTLTFTDLVSHPQQEYLLTVTMTVADRPSQTIQIQRTMKIAFTGGAWTVTELAGPASGSGAAEGGKYILTLTNTAVDGDADVVDADFEISSTADSNNYYVFDFNLSPHLPPGADLTEDAPFTFDSVYLHLRDGSHTEWGHRLPSYINDANPAGS